MDHVFLIDLLEIKMDTVNVSFRLLVFNFIHHGFLFLKTVKLNSFMVCVCMCFASIFHKDFSYYVVVETFLKFPFNNLKI